MCEFLTNLWSKISSIDFIADFINTLFGVFLGFMFAIFIERKTTKKKRLESIENIKDELRDILKSLSQMKQDSDIMLKDDRVFPSQFARGINTPIWDAVQGNGDLLQFRGKEYYNDLIIVYNLITGWKQTEDWAFENYSSWSDEEKWEKGGILVNMRNRIFSILSSSDGNSGSINELLNIGR